MGRIKWIIIVLIVAVLIFLGLFFFKKEEVKTEVFTEISLKKYQELMDSNNKVLIYISSKNDFSKEYEDNVKKILEQKNKKMYYLNLSKLKDDDIITFMNTDEFTKDSYIEPMILVIKDSRIKDKILGVVPKTEIINFLEKHVD